MCLKCHCVFTCKWSQYKLCWNPVSGSQGQVPDLVPVSIIQTNWLVHVTSSVNGDNTPSFISSYSFVASEFYVYELFIDFIDNSRKLLFLYDRNECKLWFFFFLLPLRVYTLDLQKASRQEKTSQKIQNILAKMFVTHHTSFGVYIKCGGLKWTKWMGLIRLCLVLKKWHIMNYSIHLFPLFIMKIFKHVPRFNNC